ncbi:MAG: hypothetical protein RR444_08295 [Oscillospiraceae bacterium]
MPVYPVFKTTDWGMTPDEVLCTLGWSQSDWKDMKTDKQGGVFIFAGYYSAWANSWDKLLCKLKTGTDKIRSCF